MEDIKELLYDDVEQKYIALQDKKKKRKKRIRRTRRIVILTLLVGGMVYFFSDFSKVKSLSVSGNTYYSEEDILSMADLSYETRFALMPSIFIQWNLEKQALIEQVDVEKDWNGAITIQVQEKTILGSLSDEAGVTYVIASGNPFVKLEVDDGHKRQLAHFPLLGAFDDENLQKLVDAFNIKKREVNPEIIAMISEIQPYARSYDEHMVKLIMQDGNTLFSSYDGIPLLNDYKQVLRSSNKTHVCMELDESNASIYESSCDK